MSWWIEIPFSTIIILMISMFISFLSVGMAKFFVKAETLNMVKREMSEYNELLKLSRSGDEKHMAKLKKKQQHLMQLQALMFKQQLKMFAITFIPFLAVFLFFSRVVFPPTLVVAYSPFSIPLLGRELTFYQWYPLCALAFGPIISNLLGYSVGYT